MLFRAEGARRVVDTVVVLLTADGGAFDTLTAVDVARLVLRAPKVYTTLKLKLDTVTVFGIAALVGGAVRVLTEGGVAAEEEEGCRGKNEAEDM